MKFVRNLLDKTKPKVKEGKKPGLLYWLHDSLETFAFTPNHVTKGGTHIKDPIDLKRTMFIVILALQPCLLFGMWNVGHQYYVGIGEFAGYLDGFWPKIWFGLIAVLPLIVVSYGVGLLVEFIFCTIKGHEINEGFLVSGMLIPLIMPVDVPLWMVAVATIFAVVIGKEVFGGTGMNILNVALTTRAFLFFAYPTKMTGNSVWIAESADKSKFVDGFTGETPLGEMFNTVSMAKTKRIALEDIGELDKVADAGAIEELQTVVSSMDASMAEAVGNMPDTMDMLIGTIPGSIGETSVIACLLGAGLLIMTRIGSWRIMLSMLLGGYFMGLVFNAIGMSPFMDVPAHEQLMLGGFMFGLVFMATDPVTAAQTTKGKWIYGFLAGFFAISIRVFNPAYPEGVMLAILFMNVMAPMIDHYVVSSNIKKRLARAKKAAGKTAHA